jgi:hypothetical protein
MTTQPGEQRTDPFAVVQLFEELEYLRDVLPLLSKRSIPQTAC